MALPDPDLVIEFGPDDDFPVITRPDVTISPQVISFGPRGPKGESGDSAPATSTSLGSIKLAGDISGTAEAPTVPGLAAKADTADLADVATSGSYSDLVDTPTIPSVPVTSVSGRTGDVVLTKADVGLGNADNTSDTAKPVSTATQTALDAKAPLASPALTGTPTAPTATQGNNSTQVATTAYVDAAAAAVEASDVDSFNGRTGAVSPASGDYTAGQVTNVPAGAIAATTVQAAVNELDTEKVAKSGDTMSGTLTMSNGGIAVPNDNYDIAHPPLKFVAPDMSDAENSKGNIIEWGGHQIGGTVYPYGIATYAYQQNPSATFTAPGTNGVDLYRKWAWIVTHYDSPLSTGEDVHQHLNLETVKADWLTAITRFQISFGEDVALVSFPNSHVKVYNDKNFQIGSDAAGLYIKHDTGLARIVFSGDTPWNISGTGGLRIGSVGAPGGRVHAERADDGIMFYAKNTAAGGTATAQILIEAVTSGSTSIAMKVTGESVNRFSSNHSGKFEWGSGSLTRDTNLYRNAADQLKTDDTFIAGAGLVIAALTGLLKAASGTVSAAAAGTDYYAPGSTDVAVADGGTGASTAAGARTNLGLVIGTDIQAFDSDLATIAGLTATTDNFIVAVASAWASRTPAQVKSTLSLNNVENTALSTWAGSTAITTLGTIATGVWNGTIITSAFGGTGNGFTKFTGPASSEKTFTLPNASATVLTDNTAVTVAQGGTGAATLTGLVQGNGTSPMTAAAAGTDYYAPGATDVAVVDGGTGASTAAGARTNLSVPEASGFAKITVSTSAPGSPSVGDLWVDTN